MLNTLVRALPAVLLLLLMAAGPAQGRDAPRYGDPSAPPQLSQQGMLEMLTELEQLQREVQELRGEVEVQSHALEQIQRQQRQQYEDIDRRLNRMENGAAPRVSESLQSGPAPVRPRGSSMPGSLPPNPSPPVVRAPEPAISEGAPDQAAYNHAKGLLNEGEYQRSAEAFRGFLAKYPQSTYAANAQYWLAETYYKTRQHKPALKEFLLVVNRYPASPKATDARLKIGYLYYELQDWGSARRELSEVIRQAPNTSTARLAQQRLDRMQREGH